MAGGTNTLYPNLYRCLTENEFWCSCPYTHLNISTLGKYRPCCSASDFAYSVYDATISQHFNSRSMFQLRKEFENDIDLGVKSVHCSKCLDAERKHVLSKRMRLNLKLLKDIRNNTESEYLLALEKSLVVSMFNQQIDIAEIQFRSMDLEFFGNLCNLNCAMCRSEKSSTFDKKIVNPYIDLREDQRFMKEFFSLMKRTPLVKCTGGELTINSSFFDFVKDLSRLPEAENQTLEFVTNGMVFPNKLMPLLSAFKKVCVCISVDGYGKINDIQRRGANFSVVDKTIDKYKEYFGKENVMLLTAVSPLNCSRLEEIYLYAKSKDVNINMSCVVTQPREYCIGMLPDELRQLYLSKLNKSKYGFAFVSTLQFLNSGQYDQVSFYKYLDETLKAHGKETVLKYYPEYLPYLERMSDVIM